MARLAKIGLGNFIKSARRVGKTVDSEIDVVYSDLSNISNYLSAYSGFFEETYSDSTIDPNQGGINGENILISNTVSTGTFFNTTENRPKTLKEILTDINRTIDLSLGSSDVSTQLLEIKDTIGINIFDAGEESSPVSVDKRIEVLDSKLIQIAADCFNRGRTIGDELDTNIYQASGQGGQTQSNSLRDLIDKLLAAHGGLTDLGHDGIVQNIVWPLVLSSDEVISGGSERYAAPFGLGYNEFASAQKFYNPMENPVKIDKLYVYLDENSLVDNLTVTVYKNGIPTDMILHIAGGKTGSAFHIENKVTVEPNSYIQFKITAGIVGTGTVHINNISLTLQELI
jgi:hypothetical protein